MKKSVLKSVVFLLFLLLCSTISPVATFALQAGLPGNAAPAQQTEYSFVSFNDIRPLANFENVLTLSSQIPVCELKNNPHNPGVAALCIEKSLISRQQRYVNHNNNFPFKFQNTDIIFPAHYFW